jgi:MSHA biogenesis protein MshJ
LAQSTGIIPPYHLAETLRDVLQLQHGIVLVSLRNLPPERLPPEKTSDDDRRLYVHTIELVLEGQYLDVLDYLRTLEALPWHFYWRQLELTTTHYPTNRIRLELGTFSAESDWMGL